ncbi:hypothetical protein DYBT9275_02481 [Dyadobacter sp. CECT 9275]|uniref:Uncharacterized protein n=1 Tax=Dyadobacter helix TaxID=2822344 RepID=A0A916JD55_9BACT|nr:hypothetical protein [Dyadobacter sp. CECT 9275]CAG5000526.1 hypothetical protein DYBT9275_02481 [Dyadobacter sp. CECT 9275]
MKLLLFINCLLIYAGESYCNGMAGFTFSGAAEEHRFVVHVTPTPYTPILVARAKWGSQTAETFRTLKFLPVTGSNAIYELKITLSEYNSISKMTVFSGENASREIRKTDADGNLTEVTLFSPIVVPVSASFGQGSISSRFNEAVVQTDIDFTNAILEERRMGIRLQLDSNIKIVDYAILDLENRTLSLDAFFCGRDRKERLESNYGYDTTRLNIYYTDFTSAASFRAYMGYSCMCVFRLPLKNAITINQSRTLRTLAHEVGHFLDLNHVYNSVGVNNSASLMFYRESRAPNVTPMLSVGEAFQANFSNTSGLFDVVPALNPDRDIVVYPGASSRGTSSSTRETASYPATMMNVP